MKKIFLALSLFVGMLASSSVSTNSDITGVNLGGGGSGSGDALTSDPLSQFASTTSAELAGVLSDETGSGAACFATSPTFVTPILGTPASGILTNASGLPISTGVSGLASGAATFLGTSTSANLAALLTNESGSGAAVFATSPTLVTPALGVPSSVDLTNGTSLPISSGVSGLASGAATFLGTSTSANLAALLTNETGSGAACFATSPTLVTPILGTPASGVATNLTGLPLTTGVTGVLPVANYATGSCDSTKYVRGDGACTAFPAGSGDFVGPGSATDNALVVFDGTTGKLGQNSALLQDTSNLWLGIGGVPLDDLHIFGGAGSARIVLTDTTSGNTLTDGSYIDQDGADLVIKNNESGNVSVFRSSTGVFTATSTSTTVQTAASGNAYFDLSANSIDVGNKKLQIYNGLAIPAQNNTGASVSRANNDSTVQTFDTTSNAITANLHTAVGAANSSNVNIYCKTSADNNAVTIDPSSTQTLDGFLTRTLEAQGDCMLFGNDGANWKTYLDSRNPLVLSKTANFTITKERNKTFIECDATSAGGDLTMTAYAVAGAKGNEVILTNIGTANNCIFDGNASEQVWEAGTSANTNNVSIGVSKSYYTNGTLWRVY